MKKNGYWGGGYKVAIADVEALIDEYIETWNMMFKTGMYSRTKKEQGLIASAINDFEKLKEAVTKLIEVKSGNIR